MTDRATLEDLLARVLEGEGPDRELDARIYILLTGGSEADADYAATDPEVTCKPPRYTSSLDAALTLVPEGRDWHVQSNPSVIGACWASISSAKHDLKLREWGSGMMKAATPERALIAACLKARMEAQGE